MNLTTITEQLNALADEQGDLKALRDAIAATKEDLRALRAETAKLRREALLYKDIVEKATKLAEKDAARIRQEAEKEAEKLLLEAKLLLAAAKRVKPESKA